jgi:hypothetical protein
LSDWVGVVGKELGLSDPPVSWVPAVEVAIAAGMSLGHAEAEFGISRSALTRHKAHRMGVQFRLASTS